MTTPRQATAILDLVAESLDQRKSKLTTEVDAVAFAIRALHPYKPSPVEVLDHVAQELERRQSGVASDVDRISAALHVKALHDLPLDFDDGVDRKWPEPQGEWDIIDIGTASKFGDFSDVTYGHLKLHVAVRFKTSSKGPGGTWSMEIAGKETKGQWGDERDIVKILSDAEKKTRPILTSFARQLAKQLEAEGWKVLDRGAVGITLEVQRESPLDESGEYPASATLFSPLELFSGKRSAELHLDFGDYGGYGRREIKSKIVDVKTIDEVKRELAAWAKFQDDYLRKRAAGSAVSEVLDEVADTLEAKGLYALASYTDKISAASRQKRG